jgi:hypothetical protein
MPTGQFTITIPEDIWIGKLSREYAEVEFKILTVFPQEAGGVALVELTASDPGQVVDAMRDYEVVTAVDILQQTGGTTLVQFETTEPILLLPVQKAGTPLDLPFVIRDGNVDWEITATHDRLSTLVDQLREFDIDFDVRSMVYEVDTTQLLTEQQTRIVRCAIETGYYDTPRESTLTELADDLGLAKSTCSETLHRAEEKIIKQFALDLDVIDAESVLRSVQ